MNSCNTIYSFWNAKLFLCMILEVDDVQHAQKLVLKKVWFLCILKLILQTISKMWTMVHKYKPFISHIHTPAWFFMLLYIFRWIKVTTYHSQVYIFYITSFFFYKWFQSSELCRSDYKQLKEKHTALVTTHSECETKFAITDSLRSAYEMESRTRAQLQWYIKNSF
jgi:hypothetical protein